MTRPDTAQVQKENVNGSDHNAADPAPPTPRAPATSAAAIGTAIEQANELMEVNEKVESEEGEETEQAYRLRVYGAARTTDPNNNETIPTNTGNGSSSSSSSFRRLSLQYSKEILLRRRSSLVESLPETPQGWAVLASILSSAVLGYEVQLQKHLTSPPTVFAQVVGSSSSSSSSSDYHNSNYSNAPLHAIYHKMASTTSSIDGHTVVDDSKILSRPIRPSLFVGTRGMVASFAAYMKSGPSTTTTTTTTTTSSSDNQTNKKKKQQRHLRFREIMTMTQDGATIAIDWELPLTTIASSESEQVDRKHAILHGPISTPVVLILHGLNNHAQFGYVQSLQRACTLRGWTAAAMNFRGCGGTPLTTPRAYNGAYTGDVRCTVLKLAARIMMATTTGQNQKLFLVGSSLGASLVTKYLGEEGLSGTLPECVAGCVALGNPLSMSGTSGSLSNSVSGVMALGVKRTILENWTSIRQMTSSCPSFRSAIRNALLAPTLKHVDAALAPIFIRNETTYPFATGIGYHEEDERGGGGAAAYWNEASSYRYVRHISVPTMQLIAGDDFLIFHPFRVRLRYCLMNPNVMVVETKCGGHLGWQESPPDDSRFGLGTSWSDVATTDFIAAVLEQQQEQAHNVGNEKSCRRRCNHHQGFNSNKASQVAGVIQSRL